MLEDVIPPNRYSGITLKVPIIFVKNPQGLFLVNVGRSDTAVNVKGVLDEASQPYLNAIG